MGGAGKGALCGAISGLGSPPLEAPGGGLGGRSGAPTTPGALRLQPTGKPEMGLARWTW